MYSDGLTRYIETLRSRGKTDGQIRTALLGAGWDEKTVNQALSGDADIPPPPPPPGRSGGQIGMWEGFEHVLMFLSLYTMAMALGLLLHQFVDVWSPAPDITSGSYGAIQRSLSGYIIRGSIATLVVSFPLFAYFYLDIIRRIIKNPQIKNLRSRKFFIYLTLVGTFIITVSKTIQTVLTFLDGNISLNFLLHLVVTVSIALLIFFRFLVEVLDDRHAT